MIQHQNDRCVICNQPGHNASQCPGETWPRLLVRWLFACVLCIAMGGIPLLMGCAAWAC